MDLTHGDATAGRQTASDIVAWRTARLRRAGFDADLAHELARQCAVDLHALIELVERGCPPPVSARILAPFDHERPC